MRFWPPFRTASIETKDATLADPSEELLALFAGSPVGATALPAAKMLSVPAVQSAVGLIAGSIAAFDLLVEKKVNEDWVAAPEHAVAELFARRPNEWTSTFDFIRDMVAAALTNDAGALAFVNRVGGKVQEVVGYTPGSFTVDYSTDGRLEPTYKIGSAKQDPASIIHLRGPFTRCPLSLAAEAVSVGKAMERHAFNLFTRGAKPGGVIETPKNVGEGGVLKMLKGWKKAHEGEDNSGKTAVLWDGATWKQMQLSSVDAQFLELWKFIILEIARSFRVPPSMLFDYERATWSNAEQAAKEWLASLELWMRPLEATMRHALFSPDERREYRVRFDRDDFSAVDLTARATAISSLISSRTLNPNEARDWLGMPPRDGGDEYVNPNTGANQPGAPAPPAPTDDPDEARDAA